MSSSVWMASSESIRSARAISWIWNRIVSRFSNSRVRNGPSATRRRFFSAMTWARNASRSRSYSRRSAMSSSVSLVMPTSAADGLEALGEATGVRLLGAGQRLEPLGHLVEALFAGRLGEARVHLGVLVGLALDGRLQV